MLSNVKMRLQKQLGKKIGEKEYPKYLIVIPPKAVKKSGLKAGQKLSLKAFKNRLVIKGI